MAALVGGAWLHSLALAAAGPVAIAAIVVLVAFATADRRAAQDFFTAYASARDFAYLGDAALDPLTPLLGAGDRRVCRHWMQGRLAGGLPCGLGHYSYEARDRDSQGRTTRRDTRHFTICVADLEAGIEHVSRCLPCLRRGIFGALDGEDWLSHRNRHMVKLESEASVSATTSGSTMRRTTCCCTAALRALPAGVARRASACALLRISRGHAGRLRGAADRGRGQPRLDARSGGEDRGPLLRARWMKSWNAAGFGSSGSPA